MAKRRAEILHKDDATKIEEHENSIKELYTSLETAKKNTTNKVEENQKLLGILTSFGIITSLLPSDAVILSRKSFPQLVRLQGPTLLPTVTPKGHLIGLKRN